MNTAKLITLGMLRGSGAADTAASFTATTTGAQTLTIAALTVSAATTVDWGDGSSDTYTGAGARTHNYAGAGTWTVRILEPANVTKFAINAPVPTLVLNSSSLRKMANVNDFTINNLGAGNSGAFNSSDLTAWRPNALSIIGNAVTFAGVWNFADLSAWNPTTYNHYFSPAFSYTIAAANLSGWVGLANSSQSWNAYTQAQVDAVLLGMNMAAAGRTVTGGSLDVGGDNAAPSGTYALECPVTTGNGAKHNLLNNGCGTVNAGRVMTTITTT